MKEKTSTDKEFNKYDAIAELIRENHNDKYFKRFAMILGILLFLVLLPYLFNGSAKIVKSYKNLKHAIKH